jgi:hypothetical protein
MHFQLPVALPYFIGCLLIVLGSLRAIHMGWLRRDRELDEEGARRRQGPRYHLVWGILWVVAGLGLVITTYIQSRR